MTLLGGAVIAPSVLASWPLVESPALPKLILQPPTGQKVLDGSDLSVFMDTGTGRPESGMFGNVRRYADGSPRFHEGIDIAPLPPWDRTTNPTDVVKAAADGMVVYINSMEQNSSLYGNYVVMTHTVSGFGTIYTLYGHLRKFHEALRPGQQISAGTPLGIMGHTPDFPLSRSHLHFEVGVIMSRYYTKIDPQHGVWNGANLYGIDPCKVFAAKKGFWFTDYFRNRRAAFTLGIVPPKRRIPDYFSRYSLPHPETNLAVDFSSEGIPLRATVLPVRITEGLKEGEAKVLAWNASEIRKGRPYVKDGVLTKRGEVLLDNFLVSPAYAPKWPVKQGEVG